MGAATNSVIPFEMPYQGRENYHFVEDVGAHFAACTLQRFEGFGAFNIKGRTIAIADFLNLVEQQAEALGMGRFAQLSIAEGAPPNLFVSDLNHEKIEATFTDLPLTPIAEGIRKSLQEFRTMADKGALAYSKAHS